MRGEPASAPIQPPAVMDPPDWRPSKVTLAEGAERVKQCAGEMRDEFWADGVAVPEERERELRWAAWRVLEAGGSPRNYVRYVLDKLRAGKRRVFWQHVLGRKAVDAWLPEFTKNMRESLDAASYVASPERRAEYAQRMGLDKLPAE